MFVFKVVQQRGKESGVYARSLFLSDSCMKDVWSVMNVTTAIRGVLSVLSDFPALLWISIPGCPGGTFLPRPKWKRRKRTKRTTPRMRNRP